MFSRTNRFLIKRACFGCTYYMMFLLVTFTLFAYSMHENSLNLEYKLMAYYFVYLVVLIPLFTASLNPVRFIKRKISFREYFWIMLICLIIDETVRVFIHGAANAVIPVLYIPLLYYSMRWYLKYFYCLR